MPLTVKPRERSLLRGSNPSEAVFRFAFVNRVTLSDHGAVPHANSTTSGVQRDAHGRIKRSEAAKRDFMRQTGHPNGWPGHVVDHVVPLKRGGCDCPSNMQWQTIEEAKAKDKVE